MESLWDHDLMLSIHAYYVGEFGAGVRASERILNSDAPKNIKESASRNLSWYINPLSKDFDVKYTKIKAEVRVGWTLFNPTMINVENGFLLLVRSSNYRISETGHYIVPESDSGVIKTIYYKILLSDNFDTLSSCQVRTPDYDKTNFPVDGLEDLRIFKTDSVYGVSGTIRNIQPHDGNCRIAFCSFDPGTNSIGHPKVIETDLFHEKNWMPISESNVPTWIHHPNLDGRTSIIKSREGDFSLELNSCYIKSSADFRGGSQLVKFDNNYYSVIHEVTTTESGKRIYYHRFCEWSTDLYLLRRSKAFYLKESRTIEFCAGLSIKDNLVNLSFGVEDKEAWVATITIENMLSLFFLEGKSV